MRKIGIITIHNSPNYGASLQAFALYEYIRQQGAEVEIIDLHRPNAHADYEQSKKYLPYRLQKKSSVNQLIITVKKLLYTICLLYTSIYNKNISGHDDFVLSCLIFLYSIF